MLLVLGGNAIAGQQGMTFGLIIAVVMNGVAYFFSDKIALRSSGAQPVTREQLPRLYVVMERLVAKAKLPMPKLYLIPQPAPNAFATGRNPSHASVAVTAGLMELMNDDELEGVIAHELSHVRNYDILITSIAATLAGAITWIASMGRRAMIFGGFGGSRDNNRNGGGLAALLMLAGFVIHIYEGTAAMPGTFRAMTNGTVTEKWAWTHHPAWFQALTGRDSREAYKRDKRRQAERQQLVAAWESEYDSREDSRPDLRGTSSKTSEGI